MSQPLIANIHSLKEVKMKEKNQQDRLLGVDRELSDDPEGRVKFEGASQEYESSSEESEGEKNNREIEHDLPDSRSPKRRVKEEGASRGYEFSSEESEGEEDNREVKDDPPDSRSRRDGSKVKVRIESMSPQVRSQWGRKTIGIRGTRASP